MDYFETVKKNLYKSANLGLQNSENGAVLIGFAPHLGAEAWLHKIYPILSHKDIIVLEEELKTDIQDEYKHFLMNYSNGLNVFSSTFYLNGMRKQLGRTIEISRQPFSLITTNLEERPRNSKESYFYIGGYNWDGSNIYIDKETGKAHFCKRYDATSLIEWDSFEKMIISEIERINIFFDEKGIEIDENMSSLPQND